MQVHYHVSFRKELSMSKEFPIVDQEAKGGLDWNAAGFMLATAIERSGEHATGKHDQG
jgi:hypothetical protein